MLGWGYLLLLIVFTGNTNAFEMCRFIKFSVRRYVNAGAPPGVGGAQSPLFAGHCNGHIQDARLYGFKNEVDGDDLRVDVHVVADKGTKKEQERPAAFDKVAARGLAGVLAIATAEAIFWAAGMPLAEVYYKYTTGEWIDLSSTDGQLKAAGFSLGYGGFATLILQYRVTLFAIPLVPVMDKYIIKPLQARGVFKGGTDPEEAE